MSFRFAVDRAPVLSFGFRPFFFGGALWSACAMPLWLALMTGHLTFATSYGAVAWHAHEFLFGYGGAIIAGFLLTAVPNWTGRLPVRGAPLLALFAVWLAGRVAMLAVDLVGLVPAIVVEIVFLPALAAVIIREIAAGRDRRNLKVGVIVAVLAAANILYHLEVLYAGTASYALRAAIAAIVCLIMLIGGRVTPSFTHNWLAKQDSERRPRPFNRYDGTAVAVGVLALALWVAGFDPRMTGVALILAGLLHTVRLARWAGLAARRELLVLVLHTGYAFVPLGFVLVGGSVLWPSIVPANGTLHAWTTGAIGVMTLAVMTRATLGHTGRALTAGVATTAIYAAVILAATTRIAAPFLDAASMTLLTVAAVAWTAAFAGFVAVYGPMLLMPRRMA
jgi:uncharacterized protein involved in response to NO